MTSRWPARNGQRQPNRPRCSDPRQSLSATERNHETRPETRTGPANRRAGEVLRGGRRRYRAAASPSASRAAAARRPSQTTHGRGTWALRDPTSRHAIGAGVGFTTSRTANGRASEATSCPPAASYGSSTSATTRPFPPARGSTTAPCTARRCYAPTPRHSGFAESATKTARAPGSGCFALSGPATGPGAALSPTLISSSRSPAWRPDPGRPRLAGSFLVFRERSRQGNPNRPNPL